MLVVKALTRYSYLGCGLRNGISPKFEKRYYIMQPINHGSVEVHTLMLCIGMVLEWGSYTFLTNVYLPLVEICYKYQTL